MGMNDSSCQFNVLWSRIQSAAKIKSFSISSGRKTTLKVLTGNFSRMTCFNLTNLSWANESGSTKASFKLSGNFEAKSPSRMRNNAARKWQVSEIPRRRLEICWKIVQLIRFITIYDKVRTKQPNSDSLIAGKSVLIEYLGMFILKLANSALLTKTTWLSWKLI